MKLPVDYTKLTPQQRRLVRDEYKLRQDGKCWFCNEHLSGKPSRLSLAKKVNKNLFPKGFFDYPVHLQHCHKTNMTEGAVHAHCNAVLWQYHGR
jgi:hypothetical protein